MEKIEIICEKIISPREIDKNNWHLNSKWLASGGALAN